MVRVSRLIAIVVAVVLTAFTFGQIGQSAITLADAHAMPIARYCVSQVVFGTGTMLHSVVTTLYRIASFGTG